MKKLLLFIAIFIAFGSNAQLRLVKDLRPGPGNEDSTPTSFFVYDGRLFFSATTDNGRFVFSTDGTDAGTDYVRFDNAVTGLPAINTFGTTLFFEYNSNLYFDAKNNSNPNTQIVKLTGSSNAVTSVFDLTNHTGFNQSRFVSPAGINNKIVFNPLVGSQVEPTVIDLLNPTNSGTLYDVNPGGSNTSSPLQFTLFGTNCFFVASNADSGRELWKTDGTTAGTSLYMDVFSGSGTANVDQLIVLGSQLIFAATHPTLGRELFRTNGAGSLTVLKDINTSGNSNPANCAVIDGLLYFSADNGANGQALWISAGTSLSTYVITNSGANPRKFTKIGSTVFYVADHGVYGTELFKTDGVAGGAGTSVIKNINPNTAQGSSPDNLVAYNGKLYFTADDGTNGRQLWVSDGTDAGTTMITINSSGTSDISGLTLFNNELYFAATASSSIGQELYAFMDPALANSTFEATQNGISIYPNPSKSYFNITTELTIEKVEVYTILGQLVKKFEKQDQYSISDLSKSTYIVKINTSDRTFSKALIVE